MIDFFLIHKLSNIDIQYFLSNALSCDILDIDIFDEDEFYKYKNSIPDKKCLCVVVDVSGNVEQLVKLYRYELEKEMMTNKLITAALLKKIDCYIPGLPNDSFYKIEGGNINTSPFPDEWDDGGNNYYYFK